MPTQTQPTNQNQPTIGLKPQPNQPKTSTHNPHSADPKRRPKTHIETHPKSHTHNLIKRDLKIGGESCGCRWRGLENEAARLAASCGERGGEIGDNDWKDRQRGLESDLEQLS